MNFTNNICNICKKIINYDEKIDNIPNCVVCPESHRCHNVCLKGAKLVACPVCDSKDMKFCTRIVEQAKQAAKSTQRIGGKRKKTKKVRKEVKVKKIKRKSKRVNKYK